MMQTIHRVGGKTILWRLMAPLCVLCGLALAGLGGAFLFYFGVDDLGPNMSPLYMRILFGGLFLAMGIGITLGSCIYSACYVSRIQVDREEGLVRFSVAGFVRGWSFTVRPDDIVSARFHDGYYRTRRMTVNAPWTTVRLRGRRLPLVVDEHPAFSDWQSVDRLLTHQSLALEPVRKWEARTWMKPAKKRKSMKKKAR